MPRPRPGNCLHGGHARGLGEPRHRDDTMRLPNGRIALAAMLSLGFSVAVTKPLRRIRQAAIAMAGGDLSIRLKEHRRDEFGEVARALEVETGGVHEDHRQLAEQVAAGFEQPLLHHILEAARGEWRRGPLRSW